jgi:hypothetical protein
MPLRWIILVKSDVFQRIIEEENLKTPDEIVAKWSDDPKYIKDIF